MTRKLVKMKSKVVKIGQVLGHNHNYNHDKSKKLRGGVRPSQRIEREAHDATKKQTKRVSRQNRC